MQTISYAIFENLNLTHMCGTLFQDINITVFFIFEMHFVLILSGEILSRYLKSKIRNWIFWGNKVKSSEVVVCL